MASLSVTLLTLALIFLRKNEAQGQAGLQSLAQIFQQATGNAGHGGQFFGQTGQYPGQTGQLSGQGQGSFGQSGQFFGHQFPGGGSQVLGQHGQFFGQSGQFSGQNAQFQGHGVLPGQTLQSGHPGGPPGLGHTGLSGGGQGSSGRPCKFFCKNQQTGQYYPCC